MRRTILASHLLPFAGLSGHVAAEETVTKMPVGPLPISEDDIQIAARPTLRDHQPMSLQAKLYDGPSIPAIHSVDAYLLSHGINLTLNGVLLHFSVSGFPLVRQRSPLRRQPGCDRPPARTSHKARNLRSRVS